jgi:HD domain
MQEPSRECLSCYDEHEVGGFDLLVHPQGPGERRFTLNKLVQHCIYPIPTQFLREVGDVGAMFATIVAVRYEHANGHGRSGRGHQIWPVELQPALTGRASRHNLCLCLVIIRALPQYCQKSMTRPRSKSRPLRAVLLLQVLRSGPDSDVYQDGSHTGRRTVTGMCDPPWATAERLLGATGDRWAHVKAVASRAWLLGQSLPQSERHLLLAAAWLHDVGYAPGVAATGFHALDGARFLQDDAWDPRVCALVAHHSFAQFEAEERGMLQALELWPREEGPVMDALLTADMTTGPQGQRFTVGERIREILERYSEDSPVHRANARAAPMITAAVNRAEERLRLAEVRLWPGF